MNTLTNKVLYKWVENITIWETNLLISIIEIYKWLVIVGKAFFPGFQPPSQKSENSKLSSPST